ncbi:putative peptidase [Hyaloscypha bicolor E]|uniref:Putative peptidase n=1 Tax=Hyaloscypha bicolor E TaxID=1095630 RepID=A0A2J6SH00_9HELO|nr:putative peptidase [Hyaloscypha bicolor E]PMD50034.1 putative peptidase [Hyaloscypha bicolor E]
MESRSLLKLVEADAESHISFLQSFIRAASPNPPGDTRLATDVLISYLRSHSVSPEMITPQAHMPNIVSSFTCTTPDWACDPWSGDLVDGRIHGRGAVDMKAGTAASVIAYSFLYRYRHLLSGSLALCAVSGEETGGKWGSKYLLELDGGWKGDCMINAEPGGLGTIRFAEKGTLRLGFEIRIEGAHGAYVRRSKSATRIAARLIGELAKVEELVPDLDIGLGEYMKREDVRAAIDEAMGKGAAGIVLKPTLNIGTIHGGLKINMIPDRCVFEADIRLPVGLKAEQVMDVIYGILEGYSEASVEIHEAASNPAAACSHDHPMVEILVRNAELVIGKRPLAIPSVGATDCKFWRYKGVPVYVFGVSPETMAARDESVSVDEFLAVIKAHVLASWEYLGGKT